MFKSKDYLDYISTQPCVITGEYGVHVHHESVIRRYSGAQKRQFDFGAVPLSPHVHLVERHGWGKRMFWDFYNMDPVDVVKGLLDEYIEEGRSDAEKAEKARDLL